MDEKELALMTIVQGYTDLSIKYAATDEPVIKRMLQRIKKFKHKPRCNINLANKHFQRCKELDMTEFEDKNFSSVIMVILIMDYLINERRNTLLRSKFGDVNFKQMIQELEENSTLRCDVFHHHRVTDKMVHEDTATGFKDGEWKI